MSGGTKEKSFAAFDAMKDLGIPWVEVAPVLVRLLKDNENNWELIEDANYHLLADQIFEEKEIEDENKEASNSSSVRSKSQKNLAVDECSSSLNPVKKRKWDEREEGAVWTNKKAAMAILAMIELGIHRDEIKLMLSRHLKDNENNWELIEEANYHLLVDKIFEGVKASRATLMMIKLGIHRDEINLLLGRILKDNENNWDPMDKANYHLLAYQIFEAQEKEIEAKKKEADNSSSNRLRSQKKRVAHEFSSFLNPRKKKLDEREEGMVSTMHAMKELGIAAHEAAQKLKRLLEDSESD